MREKSELRNNHTVAVLGVPNVGVLKPVDIALEPAIGVEVHVGNEKMRGKPSDPLPVE